MVDFKRPENYECDPRIGQLEPIKKFYVSFASKGKTCLEVGCGAGRIGIPFVKLSKAPYYGVDASEQMLKLFKDRCPDVSSDNVTLIHKKIENYQIIKNKFDLIICPYNTFQYLLNEIDQVNFLQNCYQGLKPGGKLIFDILNPSSGRMRKSYDTEFDMKFDFEGLNPNNDNKIKRYQKIILVDNDNKLLHKQFKYDEYIQSDIIKESVIDFKIRIVYQEDIMPLIHQVFENVEVKQGFYNQSNQGSLIFSLRKNE